MAPRDLPATETLLSRTYQHKSHFFGFVRYQSWNTWGDQPCSADAKNVPVSSFWDISPKSSELPRCGFPPTPPFNPKNETNFQFSE